MVTQRKWVKKLDKYMPTLTILEDYTDNFTLNLNEIISVKMFEMD